MAYSVSQDFKTYIKDQTASKSCLILFDDLFFSTSDFTDSGVVFNQFFNTSDDLTFGDCPSDTLSFSVVANGALAGYSFGKCRAYLGVQTDSQPYAFGSINAHIEVGAYTWTASSTGLYCDGSLIDNGEYVSLISDGTYVYAVGLSSSYKSNIDGSDGSAWTPNRFMARKLKSGLSAVFDNLTAYVWDGTNVLTYEYVPMGVYLVEKPRSTVGDTVVVQDAYDQMRLFDLDASQFLASLTYPITLSGIYTALCDFVGVSYASSTFTYSTTSYASSPFSDTSCTLRDILWWIAERARAVAHFNRIGQLALMVIGTTEETLTASDIGQDGYSIAEYLTPAVTGVLLKGTNGSSLTFGTLDTPYVISANPFVSTITASDLNAYWAIPRYVPMELNVLEADPSVDVGDLISVKPMVDEIILLANVYDEIYVNNSQEAYALNAPQYSIPLMERQISFIGAIRAKYTATGNEVREADISDTEYNANVATNMANDYTDKLDTSLNQQSVFNRLTNNGTAQGIFLDSNGNLYVNGTYIQAHTVAVDKLTGTIHDSGNTWEIDLTNGTMTIGTLNADNINGGTISGSSINLGSGNFVVNGSTGAVTIKSGSINIGSGVFKVDSDGKVTATSGAIGGFTIANSKLTSSSFDIDPTGVLVVEDVGGILVSKIEIFAQYSSGGGTVLNETRMRSNAMYSRSTFTNSGGVVTSFRSTKVDNLEIVHWDGTDENSSVRRFVLDSTGLKFYNSSGTQNILFAPPSSGSVTIQPVVVSAW